MTIQRTRYLPRFLAGLSAACLTALGSGPVKAQQPKAPQWAYAFDLGSRKLGESEFTPKTMKYGVEVFRDANNGLGIYLDQTGAVAGAAGFEDIKLPLKDSKAPQWIAGLDLKARQAGEQEFTSKTKTYSMEVFHDGNTGNWLYITETGKLAATRGKKDVSAPSGLKAPVWLHSMDLRCRKAGHKDWGKDTPAFGLEVYKDANTGNLIYICDTGSVAVVSGVEAPAEPPKEGKAPRWLHGLDLQVRHVGEKDFTKKTHKIGVEIFQDANNGNFILISEAGNIAVVPGKKDVKAPTPNPRDAKFSHGLDLSCRQSGEKDFTDKTRSFAVEVFREENLGLIVYICETGSISAVVAKQ
jgi:hypothetical protein